MTSEFLELYIAASTSDIDYDSKIKPQIMAAMDSEVIAIEDPDGGFYLINSGILDLFSEDRREATAKEIRHSDSIGLKGVQTANKIKSGLLKLLSVGHVDTV